MENKVELLSPSGSYSISKIAMVNGADAVYLAVDRFGARAYAKNLSFDELKSLIPFAKALGKKIFVTVNTIIKDSELADVFKYLDELYILGVDAVIVADIACYMYVINNLKGMECHISTQVGVKNVNDVAFFSSIGVDRVVLARELSFDEIKEIKEKSHIAIEVFIHGALCVCYSGACLMSSLLSLRSGNRGRCSQNCRREYTLYEDGKKLLDKGFYLSMRDLNTNTLVKKLQEIGVDSLKIEGRMKNETYVATITKYYRDILDNKSTNNKNVNQIFHRNFTNGFIFGEDKGTIVDPRRATSEGRLIGKVVEFSYPYVKIKLNDHLNKGDRIRFVGDVDQYFTVNEFEEAYEGKQLIGKLLLNFKLINKGELYKMQDKSLLINDQVSGLVGIKIKIIAKMNEPLVAKVACRDYSFELKSDCLIDKAMNKPTTREMIYKQINKLTDTFYKITDFDADIDDDIYISVSVINKLRRDFIEQLNNYFAPLRTLPVKKELVRNYTFDWIGNELIAFVTNEKQYNACKMMGLKTIFYKNVSLYLDKDYKAVFGDVLIGNYGAFRKYFDKEITTDVEFNVLNYQSVLHLLNFGAKHVTLSYELSGKEIIDLAKDFEEAFNFKAPLDLVIYGHERLMITKYCPLKRLNKCGVCQHHQYELDDGIGRFIITNKDCQTSILNGKILNNLDQMSDLLPYINRFRLQFTIESEQEVIEVIKRAQYLLTHKEKINLLSNETRGSFKRPIL